jgi:hypothetical protein
LYDALSKISYDFYKLKNEYRQTDGQTDTWREEDVKEGPNEVEKRRNEGGKLLNREEKKIGKKEGRYTTLLIKM